MMGRTAPFMVIETDISDKGNHNQTILSYPLRCVATLALSYITHYVRDLNRYPRCVGGKISLIDSPLFVLQQDYVDKGITFFGC
jgi:hypothetical protein